MTGELKNFISENIELINENTKESWEKLYNKINYAPFWGKLTGEFTQAILDAKINDPASIMAHIPENYLSNLTIQEYRIPDNINTIGREAFANCASLTNLVIPDSVTSIGKHAFAYCNSLTNVVIPNNITYFGEYAFVDCKRLMSVTINKGVKSIGEYMFSICSNLTEIIIPNSVISIDDGAFYGCIGLTSITIPNSIMNINAYAFYGCENLKTIIFKGTTKRWKKVNLGYLWNFKAHIEKIICTDGVIEL